MVTGFLSLEYSGTYLRISSSSRIAPRSASRRIAAAVTAWSRRRSGTQWREWREPGFPGLHLVASTTESSDARSSMRLEEVEGN